MQTSGSVEDDEKVIAGRKTVGNGNRHCRDRRKEEVTFIGVNEMMRFPTSLRDSMASDNPVRIPGSKMLVVLMLWITGFFV